MILNSVFFVKHEDVDDNNLVTKIIEFRDSLKLEEYKSNDVIVTKNEKENIQNDTLNEDKKKDKKNHKSFIGIIRFSNGHEVYIYDNPTDKHMKLGAGKLINGSVLNESGNSILFSHRETHFKVLKDIKKGDIITVKTTKDSKHYKVVNIYVTEDDNPKPYKSSDDIRITLITCYPFLNGASADERYIVVAKII